MPAIECERIPDVYSRLTERALAREELFIAEGIPVILSALEAGVRPHSLLMPKRHAEGKAASLIESLPGVPVYTAPDEELERLTGFRLTRSVLAAMYRPKQPSAKDVCRGADRVALLEGLTDSTNIGSLFRSAAALGVDAVLVTRSCCDPLVRRAVRVSMGVVFRVKWAEVPDSAQAAALLREEGITTCALALCEGAQDIRGLSRLREKRLALMIGTEGTGLSQEAVRAADLRCVIPMANGVDSLNAAAAAAVAFWELCRDRA